MANYSLNINSKKYTVDVLPDTPLLWVLRDEMNLVGTKFGCGIAQCGACTILVNDVAVRSCSLPVSSVAANAKVTTIEGLSASGNHPVQLAWDEEDVAQCGYCQSGQIMSAVALLKKTPNPTDNDIDQAMNNICRCGTHVRIRRAVHNAAKKGGIKK